MKVSCVRIRWFNDACYEIKLPDGKGILIDPHIRQSPYKSLDIGAVEAADYILISHTHFDHVTDVGFLSEQYDSRIFAPHLGGVELARCHNIPGYRMHLCSPGDSFELKDFRLECFRGKHTNLGADDCPENWPENMKREGQPPDTMTMNILGSYEYLIYLITLPSNFRILIWGGEAGCDAIKQARRFQPNISIAQLPREDVGQVARLYEAIGGQMIFLHHHDSFIAKGLDGQTIIDETIARTETLTPYTRIINPEKGRWYEVCLSAEKL